MTMRIELKRSSRPVTLAVYVPRALRARAQLSASLPKNNSSRSPSAPADPMSDQLAVLAGAVGRSTKESESERGEWMTNWGGGARGERVSLGGKEGD